MTFKPLSQQAKKIIGMNPRPDLWPATPNDPSLEEQEMFSYGYEEGKELSKGMYSDINPATIPAGGFRLIKNGMVRDKKTSRRGGTSLFTPTKPDANKVIGLFDFVSTSGAVTLVRHTHASTYTLSGPSWQLITPGVALSGADGDLFDSTTFAGNYYFTNNARDPIQLLNFGGNTHAKVSTNAPNVKRITAFQNRLIGFNVVGNQAPYTVTDPTMCVWCGDGNPTQWDYTIDITAGFQSLVESSADETDFVIDGAAFDNAMIIVRQRSLWLAMPTGVGTAPFLFQNRLPGVGCNCPFAVSKIQNGVAFVDIGTQNIYAFGLDASLRDIGAQSGYSFTGLMAIGTPIKRQLFANIGDPTTVFTSYNPKEWEFSVFVPQMSNVVKCWTYNFLHSAWSYAEYDSVTCCDDILNLSFGLTIAQLQGIIGNLQPTIANLSTPTGQSPRRLMGRADGEILVVTDGLMTDTTLGNTPTNFVCELDSKCEDIPDVNTTITTTYFTLIPYTTGTITIDYSKDDGNSWTTSYRAISVQPTDIGKTKVYSLRKSFDTNRFMWRFTSSDVGFDLYAYSGLGTVGGTQQ